MKHHSSLTAILIKPCENDTVHGAKVDRGDGQNEGGGGQKGGKEKRTGKRVERTEKQFMKMLD